MPDMTASNPVIIRKSDTGKPGNPGEFASVDRPEAESALAPATTVEVELAAELSVMIGQGEYSTVEVAWLRQNVDSVISAAATSRYGKLLDRTPGAVRSEADLRNALKAGIYGLHLHW